ncbi:helix-turn-helix domain-containing protein [Nonomuraea bangladeshensis]|uniref:helix-turn-helix domain-containing protein n=1 Tax=Nonomuraea bangladeshensis TaxID=404385 RepID=UPI0031D024D2
MHDLTVRLDALDPQAGAALRVIMYFDDLLRHRAGIQAIVRGAAVLTAGPAALVDDARQVRIRIDADGRSGKPADSPDPAWPSTPVGTGDAILWLEYSGPPRPIDAVVLERAAAAVAAVLDRTRGRQADRLQDRALVEVLLDAAAASEARTTAARRLGLADAVQARAVALRPGGARIHREPTSGPSGREVVLPAGVRAGVGPAVAIADLPFSWAQACIALRLTAEGTPADPGPRVVHAEEAGGLAVLASTVGPDTPKVADVLTLERTSQAAPWMLVTLDAVAAAPSLRAAALILRVHHSTLQERVTYAERLLGWSLGDPSGRFRLLLALVLRRLHRSPLDPSAQGHPAWPRPPLP